MMKINNTKENILWCLLAFSISLALLWQFIQLPDARDRLQHLSLKGTGYYSVNLPITALENKYFSHIDFIKRLYVIDNQKYFIYILDGTNDRHAVHDPTYCFRGSGWEITSKKTLPIEGGTAALYSLKKGDEEKDALLWFSDGKKKYDSTMQYWFQTTLRRLTLGRSGEEPLLFVVQPTENNNPLWEEHLKEIISILNI